MKNRLIKILIIIFVIIATLALSCVYIIFRPPLNDWDHSPDVLVIYTEPGPMHIDYSYIPDYRIWGNGDIIWVEYSEAGQRNVFSGKLTEQELASTVEKFINAGIFDPSYTRYPEEISCSRLGIDNNLHIKLVRDHAIEESLLLTSPEICELDQFLSIGAGVVGKPLQPQQGWLYAFPVNDTSLTDKEADFVWPENFPYSLEYVHNRNEDMVVTGEVLDYAWNIVNSSWDPIVMSNGENYQIAVSILLVRPQE